MADRITPYGAFNFLVNIGSTSPEDPLGGFSDVSGLMTEITVAEYRNGNDKENHVRKVPGVHKVGDVTLKRGLVNSSDLWEWIESTRTTGIEAKRTVVITMKALEMGQVEELLITSMDLDRMDKKAVEQANEFVTKAQQNAARIRFIEDPALLADVGGVGALLRFRI